MNTISLFPQDILPMNIWDYILDDLANVQQFWKKQFSKTVLPYIVAQHKHRKMLKQLHFEMLALQSKKKLEKFSENGVLFKYGTKPAKIEFWKSGAMVLYQGQKYPPYGPDITLLFELRKKFYIWDAYIIVEAANVFPDIYHNDDDDWEQNYGRHMIENYEQFIHSFMDSLLT
jgi:hypothetical protein